MVRSENGAASGGSPSGPDGRLASNGSRPLGSTASRKQAAANALGLLRAEGLEPSAEHEALAARWVAGEIDNDEFERLNLEQVRKRLASTAGR